MGFIFVSGTGCAAPTAAWATSRRRAAAAIALVLAGFPAMLAAMPPAPEAKRPDTKLEVHIEGLRNARGLLHLCVTAQADHFPDCEGDPAARRTSVAATDAARIVLRGLPEGDYAISAVHDENGNGRLDTVAGIPREGFGFSRNPRIGFGPPRFEQARFALNGAPVRHVIRVRYLL